MKFSEIIDKVAETTFCSKFIRLIVSRYQVRDILNINLDLTKQNQKRMLLCYVSPMGVDVERSFHALYYHINQMIIVLSELGWTVDICDCLDRRAINRFKDKKYDFIIGQGPVYVDICKTHQEAVKVLFCTENNPVVVERKYKERLFYFSTRHPDLIGFTKKRRLQYFTEEHLAISDEIILMNSLYNEYSFRAYFDRIYRINVNAIQNNQFNPLLLNNNIASIKRNFVVFGCTGFIHKGIDILLDVFKSLPDCHLYIYGITEGERMLFNKLSAANTHDCGTVNVASSEFLSDIVYRSLFVILPSCSEGMSSGVATCMRHGLIPVITRDCGFDENTDIEVLPDYTIESVKKTLLKLIESENSELAARRSRLMRYADEQFSLRRFSKSFKEIMLKISKGYSE